MRRLHLNKICFHIQHCPDLLDWRRPPTDTKILRSLAGRLPQRQHFASLTVLASLIRPSLLLPPPPPPLHLRLHHPQLLLLPIKVQPTEHTGMVGGLHPFGALQNLSTSTHRGLTSSDTMISKLKHQTRGSSFVVNPNFTFRSTSHNVSVVFCLFTVFCLKPPVLLLVFQVVWTSMEGLPPSICVCTLAAQRSACCFRRENCGKIYRQV